MGYNPSDAFNFPKGERVLCVDPFKSRCPALLSVATHVNTARHTAE